MSPRTKPVELHMISGKSMTLTLPADEADQLLNETARAWDDRVGARYVIVLPTRTLIVNLLHVESVDIRS